MARQEKIYRRLPGRGTNLLQHFRLYQGPDHLLLVASFGFTESYKRFFYRDIQAITLEMTPMGKVWTGIWGFFVVMFGMVTALAAGGAAIAFGIVAGVFLTLLIANLALGPTCKCHIRTAVQTEHLSNFRRLRGARKVLGRIETLIQEAQGEANPEALRQQWQQAFYTAAGIAYAPPAADRGPTAAASMEPPAGSSQA
jgi:hypothetical protein